VNGRNNRNDEKKGNEKGNEDGRKKILLAFLLTIWMIS
tara:strand:- start:211 stop:324 length:114 start_codon:yes stop_codon:yes gene_type:complete